MDKKTNKFNILLYFVLSVVLGFSILTLNPFYGSFGPLERQIDNYLEEQNFFFKGELRRDFISYLVVTAKDYEFDPWLILAIMKVESSFQPNAQSNRGAIGLLQIKHIAAREVSTVSPHQLFHPYTNVRIGIQYLAYLRGCLGRDKVQMLAAYNIGPTKVKRSRNIPTRYAAKILKVYRALLREFLPV